MISDKQKEQLKEYIKLKTLIALNNIDNSCYETASRVLEQSYNIVNAIKIAECSLDNVMITVTTTLDD